MYPSHQLHPPAAALLTTDTAYLPADFGPSETVRQTEASTGTLATLARAIDYGYDGLYHLTSANYTTGEAYQYAYDPMGNRLKQIIDGDTTEYLYDAANRLAAVDGVNYTFDDNGNLLATGEMTNTWDAANRLISANRDGNLVQPIYNGVGDRIGQTAGVTTTHFALDVQGLPEVIYTSDGNAFLHLPGVIVTESEAGEVRYLLSDGLGSVRQVTDEIGAIVGYQEYDPYGNPIVNRQSEIENRYGYTGEWWESYTQLLFLRARWYAPETGTFLSVDAVETEPPYLYVGGNPVNLTDPSGMQCPGCSPPPGPTPAPRPPSPCPDNSKCKVEVFSVPIGGTPIGRHLFIVHTDEEGKERTFQGIPNVVPSNVAEEYIKHIIHDRNAPPSESPWNFLDVIYYKDFDQGSGSRDNPILRGPTIPKKGGKTCLLYKCLTNAAEAIKQANISYWPHDQNSNAAAASMLKACFLPRVRPGGHHPGFEIDDLIL